MAQPRKGTGLKTRTFQIDGNTYQERRLTCGKAEHCNTCKTEGGHLAYYMDGGTVDGKRKWIYVAQLPEADPDYQPATCQREGCDNPTPRRSQKYCSPRCRMAAHRAQA
jgi:hypothetical protein